MKVSIVLPVYNGEETLRECLNAIAGIDYPKEDFELIVVNDGSKDGSHEIIEEFFKKRKAELNVKYINLKANVGRIKARLKGVEESSYENLLFIDHRGKVHEDILKEIENKDYQPIVGNLYQNKKESLIGNFFYVLRKIIYYPYWGEEFEDVFISKDNFDKIAKGFCPFFCKKELLLRNLPKEKGKNISDDTLVFSNIVEEKDILKTSDCKVEYSERNIGEGFFGHLFNRGPKFVHFYFPKSNKYKFIIILLALSPIFLLALIGSAFLILELIYIFAGLLILSLSFISLRYKLDLRDMVSIVFIGPIVWLIFTMGIWKGLLLKFLKRLGE
jgi:glycosyltransferase involved in cell wall biosynthesis